MVSGFAISAATPSVAETLESALAKAYQGNPTLNASRAGVRAIDENVAIAQSGYRPQVNVGAQIGVQYVQTRSATTAASAAGAASTGASSALGGSLLGGSTGGTSTTGIGTTTGTTGLGTAGGLGSGVAGQTSVSGSGPTSTTAEVAAAQTITSRRTVRTTYLPSTAALTVSQTLFNGFQTDNLTRRAESTVYSQRETLRFTELTVLYNAVQAYMNVLSNTATLELNRNNVEVLEEQLRQTRDRFNVGEVTRTDVAQAEARLAGQRGRIGPAHQHRRLSPEYRRGAPAARAGTPAGPVRAGEPGCGHRRRPARAPADRVGHPCRGRGRGAGEGA